MGTFRLARILVALFACTAMLSHAAEPPASVEGDWVGVFQSYPSFVQMTVSVGETPTASGSFPADLRLEPLTQGRGPLGVAKGELRYDPVSGTMTLTVTQDARRIGLRVTEFRGYYHAKAGAFGGIMPGAPTDASPFFVMTRPNKAKKLLLKPLDDVKPSRGSMSPFRRGYDDKVLKQWAQRFVDEYPDVEAYRTESGRLYLLARKMFADEHFSEHFGRTFDEFGSGRRGRVLNELRKVQPPRSNFPEEQYRGVLRSLDRGFMDMVGTYTASDMMLSVLAYRHLSGWRREIVARLAALEPGDASFEGAAAMERAASSLNAFLWPSEQQQFAADIGHGLERLASGLLVARVDRVIEGAQGSEGALSVYRTLQTRGKSLTPPASQAQQARQYRRTRRAQPAPTQVSAGDQLSVLVAWAPNTWAEQQPRLNATLDTLLAQVSAEWRSTLALERGPLDNSAAARQRLLSSKQWYNTNYQTITTFSRRSEVRDVVTALAGQRESDLKTLLPELLADVESAPTIAQAEQVAQNLIIGPDQSQSASLRQLGEARRQRIATLNYEAELARIGQGPFKVGYPGAAYLNALYRNDLARLAQEDRAIIEPIARFLRQMMRDTGIGALMQFSSGGALGPNAMETLIQAEMRNYSLANTLAGFFIVSYERVYPECMDANPVRFTRTTTWETVVSNGFGTELYRYPSGSSTTEYRVNRRHAAAFRIVEEGADPNEVNFTTALFGAFLPPDMRETFQTVGETLTGLQRAMTQRACDDPELQQLERHLIQRVTSRR